MNVAEDTEKKEIISETELTLELDTEEKQGLSTCHNSALCSETPTETEKNEFVEKNERNGGESKVHKEEETQEKIEDAAVKDETKNEPNSEFTEEKLIETQTINHNLQENSDFELDNSIQQNLILNNEQPKSNDDNFNKESDNFVPIEPNDDKNESEADTSKKLSSSFDSNKSSDNIESSENIDFDKEKNFDSDSYSEEDEVEEEEDHKINDDDSDGAVVIGSSSDEADTNPYKPENIPKNIRNVSREISDDDCETVSFHDVEDDYDDDLMNIVCTSTPQNVAKKRCRSISSTDEMQILQNKRKKKQVQNKKDYRKMAKIRYSKWLTNNHRKIEYKKKLTKIINMRSKKTLEESKEFYLSSNESSYNEVPASTKSFEIKPKDSISMYYSPSEQSNFSINEIKGNIDKSSTDKNDIVGPKNYEPFSNHANSSVKTVNTLKKEFIATQSSEIEKVPMIEMGYQKPLSPVLSLDKENTGNLASNEKISNASQNDMNNQKTQVQNDFSSSAAHNDVKKAENLKKTHENGNLNTKEQNEITVISNVQTKNNIQNPKCSLTSTCEKNSTESAPQDNSAKEILEKSQLQSSKRIEIMNEYLEKTTNNSANEIEKHISQLMSEIHVLDELIKTKENEWNDMIHLKKIKEEVCIRLTRRKEVIEMLSNKIGSSDNQEVLQDSKVQFSVENSSNVGNLDNCNPISSKVNASNSCDRIQHNATSVSTSKKQSTTQRIIQNRANMNSSELAKEKANTQRLHRLLVSRNILPKSSTEAEINNCDSKLNRKQSEIPETYVASSEDSAEQHNALNNYLSSAENIQQLIDIINEHQTGQDSRNGDYISNDQNNHQMVGRQGPFKDVKSIIADFRQQHPETVPRRGRRLKKSNLNILEQNSFLNSRPSSNDSSSHSINNNVLSSGTNIEKASLTLKDILEPYLKTNDHSKYNEFNSNAQNIPAHISGTKDDLIYSSDQEVTLHRINNSQSFVDGIDQHSGSLLHGILTKYTRSAEVDSFNKTNSQYHQQPSGSNYVGNFSPTLARLLTTPEKIFSAPGKQNLLRNPAPSASRAQNANSLGSKGGDLSSTTISNFGANFSKVIGHHNGEITITPVVSSIPQPSILQQQLQQQQQLKMAFAKSVAAKNNEGKNNGPFKKEEQKFIKFSCIGDNEDADDSIGRLVIDEGTYNEDQQQKSNPPTVSREINENEVPLCQGCKSHEAQFVCAGCGNQWYCSRECQVTAWDDHSEICTATKQIRKKFNLLKTKDLEGEEEYVIIKRKKRKNLYRPTC